MGIQTNKGLRLVLNLVIWGMAQGLTKDMTIVQEDKGIVLSGIGVLAEDKNPMFISTLVKITNPSLEENVCTGICDTSSEEIWGTMTLELWDEVHDRTGNDNQAIQILTLEGNNTTPDCFMACLKKPGCKNFGT